MKVAVRSGHEVQSKRLFTNSRNTVQNATNEMAIRASETKSWKTCLCAVGADWFVSIERLLVYALVRTTSVERQSNEGCFMGSKGIGRATTLSIFEEKCSEQGVT